MNVAGFQAGLQALQALNQTGAAVAGAIAGRQTNRALEEYGQTLQEDVLRQGRALLGEQRVALAKSGVDPGTGTAAALQTRQRVLNRLAAGRARYGTDLQRFRLGQQGSFDLASGIASAGTMLGQGILDYYQNRKPSP